MTYCTNCGEPMPDDARFCEKCGAVVPGAQTSVQPPVQEPAPGYYPPAAPQPSAPRPAGSGKFGAFLKKHLIPILIILVVLAAAIVTTVILVNRPRSVKLNQYVSVKFEGYDSVGQAVVTFDRDAFLNDYEGKIKFSKDFDTEEMMLGDEDPALYLYNFIDWDLDKANELTNGDEIVLNWDINRKAESVFHIKLSYEDLPFTVEGLEAAVEVDPFQDLQVEFFGLSPYGEAKYTNNASEDYAYGLWYTIEPSSNLKNGDKVTVSLPDAKNPDWRKNYLRQYGKKLGTTQKEYTVEGLDAYVNALAEVGEDTQAIMQKQAKDVLDADIAKNWDEPWKLDSADYLGCYLLTAKDEDMNTHNVFYVVQKVAASAEFELEEKAPAEPETEPENEENAEKPSEPEKPKTEKLEKTFYYVVYFSNLTIDSEGVVSVDLVDYRISDNTCKVERGWDNYYFNGYESTEQMFKECVASYLDSYTYETDLE